MKTIKRSKKETSKFLQNVVEHKKEEALGVDEESFRQFFKYEPAYCYMISPKGVILNVNNAALKGLGYKKKELIGKPLKIIYAPEFLPKTKQLFNKWKKTGKLREEGLVILTKNGERRIILLSASAVKDKNGKILHSISLQQDITERKNAEEALRGSEEMLRSVLSSMDDLVFVLNKDGTFKDYYQGPRGDLYIPPGKFVGKHFGDVLPPHVTKLLHDAIENIKTSGKTQQFNYWIEINGKKLWYGVKISPIRGKSGGVVGMTAVARNVTERKITEETRQKFIELATHQLRSPLVSCRWTLDLLKRRFMTDLGLEGSEYLEQMGEHLEKLLSLAKDLLNTTKIESGHLRLNIKRVYLNKSLSSIIQDNQAFINRKRIKIKENFKRKPKILIESDLEKLNYILDNLVNNAIKFSRDNSEIQIGFRKNKKSIVIYIKDKGIGIPKKEKDKIFDRFFRASNAIEADIKGNGLGLFVVKGFAKSLGADLYFKSQQNKGSTFFLKLPVKINTRTVSF